ncbi:RsiV family protein [Nocardia sp. NPDC050710]|uniref:RsiV family protein n=1 Tax=Nocardia sp. NPDC050710 TaxID=3157220 RepID=UPI0033F05B8B
MKKFAAALAVAGVMTVAMTACAATVESGAAAAPAPQIPAPGGYTATTVRLEGRNFTIDIPQVTGGAAGARADFNDGMRALAAVWSAQVQVDDQTKLAPGPGQVTYFGTRVLSGLLVVSADGGGAHPYNLYATHVTNADTGREITLRDLFADLPRGLSILADAAAVQVPGTNAGDYYSKSGIEANEYNYQNWLATPGGMEIHFGELAAHAAGDIVITVPWSTLAAVLRPGMREVVGS